MTAASNRAGRDLAVVWAGAPDEQVGLAAEEAAGGPLGVQRRQPASLLVLGDRAGLEGRGRPPRRHLRGEAGRVTVQRGEGAHADGLQPGLGQQPGELTGQPRVDDQVVGGGGDDPAGQRPVGVGEDDAVAVEVDDADAAAGARDADQLRDRPLGVG